MKPALDSNSAFYSDHISDNLSETHEGFLICHNVPVGRLGSQVYMGHELGAMDRHNEEIKVYRLEEDVFAQEAIASFEGKPVTEDHPPVFPVTPANIGVYGRGHVQNVRRDGDMLVADLVITDPVMIDKIKNKQKRQVSCGYLCDWPDHKDGYKQINIRGNHIAIVDKARAGPKFAIKDSKYTKGVRKPMKKDEAMAKLLQAAAKDSSPEEFVEILSAVGLDSKPEPVEKKPTPFLDRLAQAMASKKARRVNHAKDNDLEEMDKVPTLDERVAGLETGMTEIKDMLSKMGGAADSEEHSDEDQDKELIEQMMAGEDSDKEHHEEMVAEDSDDEEEKDEDKKAEDKRPAMDSLQGFIKGLAPALAQLNPKSQAIMKDAMAKSLGKTRSGSAYASIKHATDSYGKKAANDSQPKDTSEIGRNIAKSRNPHYMKKS